MSKEKISIYSKPAEIDAVINEHLAKMPSKGGRSNGKTSAWPDYLLELRRNIIMSYITENGCSKDKTAQQISARWDITLGTARNWVADAVRNFCEQFIQETPEEQRRVWVERCEQILESAIESGDKGSAIKALDLLGKVGVYVNKTDVNVSGEIDMKFDFQ